ncbi:MAG: hypothetical protein RSB39_01700, partial [Oscillospiraceae bacterium]
DNTCFCYNFTHEIASLLLLSIKLSAKHDICFARRISWLTDLVLAVCRVPLTQCVTAGRFLALQRGWCEHRAITKV